MSAITPEKTHALLEKLAEYVMNQVPTRSEIDAKLAHLEVQLDQKADKQDLKRLEDKVDKHIEGMGAQAGQLDILRTEMKAVSKTLDVYNERLGNLYLEWTILTCNPLLNSLNGCSRCRPRCRSAGAREMI